MWNIIFSTFSLFMFVSDIDGTAQQLAVIPLSKLFETHCHGAELPAISAVFVYLPTSEVIPKSAESNIKKGSCW